MIAYTHVAVRAGCVWCLHAGLGVAVTSTPTTATSSSSSSSASQQPTTLLTAKAVKKYALLDGPNTLLEARAVVDLDLHGKTVGTEYFFFSTIADQSE